MAPPDGLQVAAAVPPKLQLSAPGAARAFLSSITSLRTQLHQSHLRVLLVSGSPSATLHRITQTALAGYCTYCVILITQNNMTYAIWSPSDPSTVQARSDKRMRRSTSTSDAPRRHRGTSFFWDADEIFADTRAETRQTTAPTNNQRRRPLSLCPPNNLGMRVSEAVQRTSLGGRVFCR